MRNFVLLVLYLLFHDLNCQSAIGFSLGANYPQYFDHLDKYYYSSKFKPRTSYIFSTFIKQQHKKILNVGTELSFINRNLLLEINTHTKSSHGKDSGFYHLNYLYLSVFPEFSIRSKHRLSFRIGPNIGYLAHSKAKGFSRNSDFFGKDITTINTNAKHLFKSFDIRIFISMAYEIPINSKYKIQFNASLSRGITNASLFYSNGPIKIMNSFDYLLSMGVTYRLPNYIFLPKHKSQYPEYNKNNDSEKEKNRIN